MVSVVTLTYNRAHLVEDTIRSVLAQDYTDFEFLVVDDGSEDHTEEVIRRIPDQRLRYFHLPHSGKISALRNFALKESKGEFIAFVDSDDVWEPKKLSIQVKAMQAHPEVGFVFSDVMLMKNQAVHKKMDYSGKHIHSVPVSFFEKIMANRLAIYPSCILFRKAGIQEAGLFNESMTGGDMDLITRVAYRFKGLLLAEDLVRINLHEGNHSLAHVLDAHRERIDTLNYFHERKMYNGQQYRKVLAFHYRALAEKYLSMGDSRNARNNYWRSMMLNPLSPRGITGWLQTVFRFA